MGRYLIRRTLFMILVLFIVALMTDLLDPQPDHSVLEIGTGLGYQAAILGRLAAEVWSVERLPELAAAAAANLAGEGPKPERLMIDATHLKAHRTAASLLKKGMFPVVWGVPRAA